MFGTTKKDPLVDAVAKVMKENETRRQVERSLNDEIGIYSRNVLTNQQKPEYERVLAERTAIALNEGSMKKEELVGNQHKIDANKNNKVDAQDFKILKAKKGLAEADYPPGAGQDTAKDKDPDMMKGAPGEKDSTPKAAPMPPKRPANMEEEAEQIDELSKKTLGSYVKKASHDVATKSAATGRYAERANKEEDDRKKTGDYSGYRQGRKDNETADKMFGKSWKRRQGIAKAVDKMTKEDTQIDEVLDSKMKKLSYVMKAKKSIKNSDPKDIKQANDIANRVIGVKRVMKKLTKEETINEISDKVKAAYARKADKEVTRTNTMGVAKRTGGVGIEDAKRKMDNRKAGIKRSMSEEEQLDERNAENKAKKDAAVAAVGAVGAANKDEKHLGSKGTGIRNSIADKIRGREVTSGKDRLEEKAPSGDKYERMVKHIKDKYSKGGLTDKEKSIAYATAQKAKNKDSE
ncbi:hypothetical protein UFOVP908_13 [uncultured Caudovirales phage]|uniref:Uncharacterized protein n=1 Tax=uncultured Caudovirales phage TaxID=2100421 RepID=A0A6J5PEJ0_9CAUD|nr:hypothetical protein UFOVP908_13 [uncultured Caudovirales phage]CAB4176988.1 hypothetical protein UFOVP990_123 [uncultured Caudovirales phage]CAB4182150.1 hypothetical protein UFOVP1065_154 [uncultured Caudovirales phage]CAB4190783.1 hypothetical protein UFOVP1198_123 [uncultured Caudovirales phage]CAB4211132.1 hypothetical protein UFOVP1418_115 [uncultured Caudovirales phage]